MVSELRVAGRVIGPGHPCFIVAEAGVNHNGDVDIARRLIDVAVQAGADAVKFQTFKAERVLAVDAPKADYQIERTGRGESQLAMAKRLELPFDAFRQLSDYCYQQRSLFLSTPFDEESADFLAALGVPLFKIPSGELTNLSLLAHVARYGRPMIVSTGMSTLNEVEAAVRTIEGEGNQTLALLHCTSSYPADPAESNLRAMETLRTTFGCPVGYSDHTPGLDVALAAAALGACIIEKHVTLDRTLPGPDHRASLEPNELCALVAGIRRVESALGDGIKRPTAGEMNTRAVARRSVVAARPLDAGRTIRPEDLAAKRAAVVGLSPARMPELIGRKLLRPLDADAVLQMDDLAT